MKEFSQAELKLTNQQPCVNHNISNHHLNHKQKCSHAIVFESKRK